MTGNPIRRLLPVLIVAMMLTTLPTPAQRAAAKAAESGVKVAPAALDSQYFERDRQNLVFLQKVVERIIQGLSLEMEPRRQALQDMAVQLYNLANSSALPLVQKARKQLEQSLQFFKPDVEIPVFRLLDEQKIWRDYEMEITQAVKRQGQLLDALRLMHKASQEDNRKLENLIQAENQLLILLKEKNEAPVRQVLALVGRGIAAVPPPALLTILPGMDLLPLPPDNAWYISKTPVSWRVFVPFLNDAASAPVHQTWAADQIKVDRQTGSLVAVNPDQPVADVSWDTAAAFCLWLTEKTRAAAKYELPGVEQLQTLSNPGRLAFWSRDSWEQGAPFEQQMRERFSVRLMAIWDSAQILGGGRTFGELTFATYPKLGFCVVTRSETVRQEQRLRLRKELNLPVMEEK